MINRTSQHILPSATNLLGFCLIVITSLHITSATVNSMLDEFACIVAAMLCVSVMLSFFSIKSESILWTHRLELAAEILFAISIIGILVIVLVLLHKFLLK